MNFKPIFESSADSGMFSLPLKMVGTRESSVKAELTRRGIAYVLMRNDLVTSWYEQLGQQDSEAISSFFQQDAELLYESGGYSLFRLR